MGFRSLVKSHIFRRDTHTETFHAPIWKIPSELMLLIVQKLCLDSLRSKTTFANGQPIPFPLLLSAVCSSWRHIMLDNSTLWSIISVAFTKTGKKPNGRAIHIFLERSKAAPLTVLLQVPSSLSSVSRKTIRNRAFQALLHEAPRWRILHLTGDFQILRIDRPMRMVESLPKLEVLTLENREACETLSKFQVVPMPSLYHAIIDTPRAPINPQSIPWNQITILRLRGCHNVLSLIQLCPKLTQLSFTLDSELGRALSQYPVLAFRHNHVKSLSLWLVQDPDMPRVLKKALDVLDFPSLDTLIVQCYERPPVPRCVTALLIVDKFIQRSSFTLTEFGIHDIYIFHNLSLLFFFLAILDHNPSITRLVIFDPSRSSKAQDVVDLLRPKLPRAKLLPKLQAVEFWTWKKDCDELQMELIGFPPLVLVNESQILVPQLQIEELD
ncbi:hypothetical protein BDP27DRAFT_1079448 [Rhodocollybia butyracea]|uniref:F-box domain-containing protein n=1 Tax=Rhodocollybia butyracea TaxID=206335 RepID=A0A9P5U5E5_9AGAR|nr:hypothetical protein BDP27DRAFT_1079448 [Rhodocollybia butyracea]